MFFNSRIPYNSGTRIHGEVSSVHCSTIYNNQVMEQPICPLTDKRIKKMCYMHTTEYYSARKKKEESHLQQHVGPGDYPTKWSQTEKDKYQMVSLICFPDSSVGKESTCNAGNLSLIPGLGRSPGEGNGYPLQYYWPGEFHVVYSPWGRKELDRTEWLSLTLQDFHDQGSWKPNNWWESFLMFLGSPESSEAIYHD